MQESSSRVQVGRSQITSFDYWSALNQKIFNQENPHPVRVIHKAASIGASFWEASVILTNQSPPPPTIKWNPAAPSYLKINFDGSVRFDGNCSAGYVIRDSNGSPLYASTCSCGIYVLIAEGHALLDGIIIVPLLCALETYDHSGQQQSVDSSFENQCEQSI
ncbi:hypothetical protein GBA52_020270 [Prunus armeniaca]|nr:hypothetical protein GBA52_020270 [Prunus armeniaca]